MNKKFLSLFLCGFIVLSPLKNAYAYIIDTNESEIKLSKGLVHKNITTYKDTGKENVNLLVMDLNDPNLKLELLFNKNGFSNRQTLSAMASGENDLLTAINADFFSMATPTFSLGPMVQNGKVISSPHYELNKMSTFMLDVNKNPIFTYLRPDVSIANNTNGLNITVAAINKPSKNYGNITVYTNEYMKNTPGATKTYFDLCEVIVENNIVKEVRYGQPPAYIPENGYAIIGAGNNGLTLSNSFQVGDEIRLDSAFNLDLNNIDFAVGGGSILVKDNELYPISHKVPGKSQRTALGVTNDNKLILVTIDGRVSGMPGMDENDLANYMLSLGCKNAIALDGGGSTEMIVKNEIVNTMVDKERPIANGIGIKNIAEKGSFTNIEATLDKNFGYVNEKFKIKVSTFDSNYNPVNIPVESLSFSVSGINGYFDKNIFIPTSGGSGLINVSYGGKSASIPIDVYSPISSDSSLVSDLPTDGTKIAILPDMTSSGKILDDLIQIKYFEEINKNSQNAVLISNNNLSFENDLKINKLNFKNYFSTQNIGDNLFMTIDTSSGTLYKTEGQLEFFKKTLSESTAKNIFVVLNSKTPMNVKAEIDLYKKTLLNASKTKNVYVLYKGGAFSQESQGNLKFISIPDFNETYKNDFYNDYKYLLININGSDIKYTYKNIF